ncbi:hypothetical protein [Streptomyces cylindrosporus]|nr:hypothetical protein [Streptomyces cylindrosporus]
MRIGAPVAEKPVARIDDETYVELSDVVPDFDGTQRRRVLAPR